MILTSILTSLLRLGHSWPVLSAGLIAACVGGIAAEPTPPDATGGSGGPVNERAADLDSRVQEARAAGRFWSFVKPRRPSVPTVENDAWPDTDVDRFILARLESEGLAPAEDVDRSTLIRRLYFDLLGLPPSPEVIASFVADPSPRALQKKVDGLLASPRFGERWGRHWLDVARFAESSGGGRSLMFKNAWRYRDYVINAFNNDKPYSEFILEQIAGDLIPAHDAVDRDENLVATGYLVLGPTNYELQDKELLRMEVIDEQIDTMGRTFLGLSIGCARCHDHKFDPIPTTDYYALAGIFGSTRTLTPGNVSGYVERELAVTAEHRRALDDHSRAVAQIEQELKPVEKMLKTGDTSNAATAELEARAARLKSELKQLAKDAPVPAPRTMSVEDVDAPQDGHVHLAGAVRRLGPRVRRGFLTALSSDALKATPKIASDQSGRLELARWLSSLRNPLTARVIVNRIWHHLHGTGLVRTTDDFGSSGESPSHPELLDYLALRFLEDDEGSIKRLVRHIVLSRTYRLSTSPRQPASSKDPENRWLSHAHRKPLDAESLRDAMLAVSGRLDHSVGGLTIRKFSQYDLGYEFDTERRSVYVPAFRNATLDLFEVFDAANPNIVMGQRPKSTLATQALFLMNSPFVIEEARAAAQKLLRETERSGVDLNDAERIHRAYLYALGREPTPKEHEMSLRHVAELRGQDDDIAAWAGLYQALFASVDFRHLN